MIKNAQFLTSIADIGTYERFNKGKAEIIMLGRSNVGKSTFINFICNNGKLAKVSQTAGKTRLLNVYSINNDDFWLIDLPGYGFAQDSKENSAKWSGLIESYLQSSKHIRLAFLLLDIRREPSELDMMMINFLYFTQTPFKIIATKCDKLSKAAVNKQIGLLASSLGLGIADITPVSATTKQGKNAVFSLIGRALSSN